MGLIIWLRSDKVVWQEWVGASLLAFLISGVTHIIAAKGMTDDVETWSGQVSSVQYIPRWKEYYEEAIYKTEYYYETETRTRSVGSGKNSRTERYTVRVQKSRRVFDRWESRNRWHESQWLCETDLNQSFSISQESYNRIVARFGKTEPRLGRRRTGEHASRMIDGDPNDYWGVNINRWCEPVTRQRYFENRVKASPSVFSFVKVPTNINVFPYPQNNNIFHSDRLLGDARSRIDILKFDQLNSFLGARKKVNLIIVGFNNADSMLAEYQRAEWIGGKKNDIVMVYNINSNSTKPSWTRVFGWSESEICKRNLESILLTNQINDSILDKVKDEVIKNYVIKDWSKFDYLTIEPRTIHFIWFFVIQIITQIGLYIYFHYNEFSKYESGFKKKQNNRRYRLPKTRGI